MKNYSFYVSLPVMDRMVDFNNKKHVKLITFMQELHSLGNVSYSKSQAAKARRLIKSALGDSGECSIHGIDLKFRECKYPTMEQNNLDLVKNTSWVDVSSININTK